MCDNILYDGSYLLHLGVGWFLGQIEIPQWLIWVIAIGKEIFDLATGNKIDITDILMTVLGYYYAIK